MPSVTIDAGVLVAPPPYESETDADSYVKTLLEWSSLVKMPWMEVFMTLDSAMALEKDGLYPLYPRLKEFFSVNGIEHYSVNDVDRVVGILLNQCVPSFEEYFHVREVISEEFSAFPDVLSHSQGNALRCDLTRCMLLTAILRKYCRESIRSHALILQHAPSRVVSVRAVIDEVEHDRDDIDDLPVQPETFEGEVLICDDFRGLIECMDGAAILANSQDKMEVEAAIRIGLFVSRIERGGEPEWDTLPSFRIGKDFLDTIVTTCRAEKALPEKILRAIVESLEDLNQDDVHALRTGSGGGDPPQMRGKDRAMRRDIDPTHHLHYWSCEGGLVELANVSFPHDNFKITY